MREIEVKGNFLAHGVPRSFTVTSEQVCHALKEPLAQIVSAIRIALELIPPELGADIVDRGIILTGGGALLRDLDKLLEEETGLPVVVADLPLKCVVLGCGAALEQIHQLRGVLLAD
jgi:rod shape-determining protein MreB